MTARRLLLAAGLLIGPATAGAQDVFPATADDRIAVAVAAFRTAIVHGQLTAHGDAAPDVLCLAAMLPTSSTASLQSRLAEPDSSVVALLRERFPAVRPISACRIEPLRGALDNTSLVVERETGKRGLVIWIEPAKRNTVGAVVARLGYYENGFSAADWVCAVRRIDDEWIVNACRMTRIS